MSKHKIMLRLDEDRYKHLKEEANEEKISFNQKIVNIVEWYIKRLEDEEKEKLVCHKDEDLEKKKAHFVESLFRDAIKSMVVETFGNDGSKLPLK